jgi:iron complex outermembrane receptor protein
VAVVTGDTLQSSGVFDMRGLTAVTPGLNFALNGASAQPTIRGISSESSSAGDEQNVAIYVDGVVQPAGFANIGNLPDVDNVQVLKGPQGTLYGRNATGGAILISTEQPKFTPGAKFSISDGIYSKRSGNDFMTSGFVTGALVDDKLAGSLAASANVSGGYVYDVYRQRTVGGVHSYYVRGKLLFVPTDDVQVVLNAFYTSRLDRNVFAEYNQAPFSFIPSLGLPLPNNDYQVANNQDGLSKVVVYGASLNASFKTSLGTLSSLTAFQLEHALALVDADGSALPALIYNEQEPYSMWSQEFNFASRDFGPVSFLTGVYLYDYDERFDPLLVQDVLGGTTYFSDYAKATVKSASVYAQATYKLTDQLSITAGLRYTDEKKEYHGSFTPALARIGSKKFSDVTSRASVNYKFTNTTSAYFTFNQGFKSGVFDTTAFSPVPVEPEKANSYEVGLKSAALETLAFSVAAFRYDLSNLQVVQNNAAAISTLSNSGSATIEGLDLDATWSASKALTINGGVSYLPVARYNNYKGAAVLIPQPGGGAANGTIDATGHRILKAARWQGNLAGNYVTDWSWGQVTLSANLFFIGAFSYDLYDDVRQKSYALLNSQVSWKPAADSSYSFALWGRNLTDRKTILAYLASGAGIDYAYGAPREIGVSFNFKM